MIKEDSWLMYTMLVLAAYRFTHLIVFDKITEFLRKPFLRIQTIQNADGEMAFKKEPSSMFGYMLNCYWCAGIWSSILIGVCFMVIPNYAFPVILILSVAGAQSIIETFVGVAAKKIKHPPKNNDDEK